MTAAEKQDKAFEVAISALFTIALGGGHGDEVAEKALKRIKRVMKKAGKRKGGASV